MTVVLLRMIGPGADVTLLLLAFCASAVVIGPLWTLLEGHSFVWSMTWQQWALNLGSTASDPMWRRDDRADGS